MSKTLASFQIFPGKDTPPCYKLSQKYYFNIHLYHTRKIMVQESKRMRPMQTEDVVDFAAITMPMVTYDYVAKMMIDKGKKKTKRTTYIWKPKNACLGDALFYKRRIGGGVVAHESLHIALCFLRAIHGSKYHINSEHIDDAEEELAYVLTTIVRQLHIAFEKFYPIP